MDKIGVVVLNYKNYKETIRCVDSLLLQEGIQKHIVIVENGSQNESLENINKKYFENSEIAVISSDKNVGFAKGMNIGIAYLRKRGYNFIFIANSDLVFTTPNILEQMLNYYHEKSSSMNIGVVNPTMHNTDGSLSPRIQFKKNMLRLRMLKTYFPIIEKIRKPIKEAKSNANMGKNRIIDQGMDTYQNDKKYGLFSDMYVVVGSGYLLTEKFFESYSELFPDTFLYFEEYALMLYLQAAGLITIMAETDEIIHGHGKSTPSKVKSNSALMLLKLIFSTPGGILTRYGKGVKG